jgi:hypothetical protein
MKAAGSDFDATEKPLSGAQVTYAIPAFVLPPRNLSRFAVLSDKSAARRNLNSAPSQHQTEPVIGLDIWSVSVEPINALALDRLVRLHRVTIISRSGNAQPLFGTPL